MTNPITIGFLVLVLIFLLIAFAFLAQFIGLYVRAFASGSHISLFDLLGMHVRKVNALAIVNARIQASRAGINVSSREMESHVLAGGDVQRVINAMIAANKAQIELPWQIATAIDLAGRDILDAVQTSVNPKVIDVPNTTLGRTTIDGVAKDGIQLKVRPASPCEPTSRASSAEPPRKPSSPASAKESSTRSARQSITNTSWKTPTRSPKPS